MDIEEMLRGVIADAVRRGLADSRSIIREECQRALTQSRPPKQPDDAVLNSAEAAELCGVEPVTIRDWVKKGRLTPLGPSTPYRFARAEVLRARDTGGQERTELNELMRERYLSVNEANARKFTGGRGPKVVGGEY